MFLLRKQTKPYFSLVTRQSQSQSPRGTGANLKVRTIRSQNITLKAAMCSSRISIFKLRRGGVNQDEFAEFLDELFDILAQSSKK